MISELYQKVYGRLWCEAPLKYKLHYKVFAEVLNDVTPTPTDGSRDRLEVSNIDVDSSLSLKRMEF